MKPLQFNAFIVEEVEGKFKRNVALKSTDDLPEGDTLINVHYSSLNYKDALSASGNKGVTKQYPHTPGIDAVGTVVSSDNSDLKKNDNVVVTGYDLGMNTSGGFAEYIRVPSSWVVKLPDAMTMRESMIWGTAGLTAAMSVSKLIQTRDPADGKIIVSGATGGVGSLSVSILSKLGYSVTAITGKEHEKSFLLHLGAEEVLLRKDFSEEQKRPLIKAEYAGCIDTVGGIILENIIKATKPMGVVTCCGNVASPTLNLSVFPFILRGVSLIGIDSQNCPLAYRAALWNKIAGAWKPEFLSETATEITLTELSGKIDLMLQGALKGRTILNLTS